MPGPRKVPYRTRPLFEEHLHEEAVQTGPATLHPGSPHGDAINARTSWGRRLVICLTTRPKSCDHAWLVRLRVLRRRSSSAVAGAVAALQAGGRRSDPGTLHLPNESGPRFARTDDSRGILVGPTSRAPNVALQDLTLRPREATAKREWVGGM